MTALMTMILAGALAQAVPTAGPPVGDESTAECFTLNGLTISLDPASGGLLSMNYDGPGQMLTQSPDLANLLDVAYPIQGFEPLRLGARFSKVVEITKEGDTVRLHWPALGASRSIFAPDGPIEVTITMRALPDGRSIQMEAAITNHSSLPIPQVVFPYLSGLQPFEGEVYTLFRTAAAVSQPFLELHKNEASQTTHFPVDWAYGAREYTSGGMFSGMWLRWMDFGGYNGGFSLYQQRWGWEPRVKTRLHHSEISETLDLLCVHDETIAPGAAWSSGSFVLTPHRQGWAKGIEPYREWVKAHTTDRTAPVPKHVREGLGFRTIWMSQGFPADPQDAVWRVADLPKLAAESKECGLDEMVIWSWHTMFKLPLPDILPHLGTQVEFAAAIAECKALGVNVAPFISVVQVGEDTAAKYGLEVPKTGGWPQHTETVPRFQAPYLSLYRSATVDLGNKLWQEEVLASCEALVDQGITSISWDQFWSSTPDEHQNHLADQIRAYARQRDPESTFSGEECWSLETDWRNLDYTWNWGPYVNCQAYTSVFPAPRVTRLISGSTEVVKSSFMDNVYLNIIPRKAESVNGSDWIAGQEGMTEALKTCAALRKQFLSYFTEGTFIGDCVLTEPCPGAHVSAYVLPDRMLVMVMNQAAPRAVPLAGDPAPWLPTAPMGYTVREFNMAGDEIAKLDDVPASAVQFETRSLQTGEIAIYEVELK